MYQKTVLIIDDDKDLCFVLENALKKLDFSVQSVSSFSEAMGKILMMTPHIVFLDHNLPDGKGLQLTAILKQNHKPFIIFMTADPSPSMKNIALIRGADIFIEKPFRFADLQALILAA